MTQQLITNGESGALVRAAINANFTETYAVRGGRFFATDYGARFDTVKLLDATTVSAAATLSSASYSFTASDVGKVCCLFASTGESVAAPEAPKMLGTIQSVAAGVATLSANAGLTGSTGIFYFGTDDTVAIQATVDAAQPVDLLGSGTWKYTAQGVVAFPVGTAMTTQAIVFRTNTSFTGQGREKTSIKWCSTTNMGGSAPYFAAFTGLLSNGSTRVNKDNQFRDFTIDMRAAISNVTTYHRKCVEAYYMIHPVFMGMGGLGSPATAFGCDFVMGGVVMNNYVENPGRLWTSGAGGSSGFDFQTYVAGGWTPALVPNELDATIYVGNIILNPAISGIRTTDNSVNQAVAHQIISNNLIITNKTTGKGIEDNAAQGTIITGNIVICTAVQTSGDTGVDQESWGGILSTGGRYGMIEGNTILGGWYHGVRLMRFTYSTSTLVARDYVVANNSINGSTAHGVQIEVNVGYSTSNIQVQGNRVSGTGAAGIAISFSAASAGTITDVIINDNQIRDAGQLTAVDEEKSGILIKVPTAGFMANNNYVVDTAGASKTKYGLTVDTVAVTDALVTVNHLKRGLTTAINLANGGSLTGISTGNYT